MATRQPKPLANFAAPLRSTRIMLVDDSLVVRSILERIIGETAGLRIVASVPSAAEALTFLARDRVDVVVLDIEMPGMTGIDALPLILKQSGGARVLILSSNCEEGGPAAVEALAAGASDTLAKPGKGSFAGRFSEILTQRLLMLGDVDQAPTARSLVGRQSGRAHIEPMPVFVSGQIGCIAVAASTGGIPAFTNFTSHLDPLLDAPILLTQHLPEAFIGYYAKQLAIACDREVFVGAEAMRLKPGAIYLAPGTAHMSLVRVAGHVEITLDYRKFANGCCPSADPMFSAVAKCYGARGVAVVLSGMGRDGADGAAEMKQAGGTVLAQAPESCVVWGMPGAVVKAGVAAAVLNPDAIGVLLSRYSHKTSRTS